MVIFRSDYKVGSPIKILASLTSIFFSELESKHEFVVKVRELVNSWPRPIFVVLRYLFAFLNHLSEFSDENMMDPYNLAICFGPTLVPIPPDRDQVQFQVCYFSNRSYTPRSIDLTPYGLRQCFGLHPYFTHVISICLTLVLVNVVCLSA